jgi:4-oxalocrotonate tautomerase
MPILNLTMSAEPDAQLTEQAAALLMRHTQGILRKAPELTAIAIQYVPVRQWFIDGKTLAAQDKASFFLDIKISDETNTAQEKAAYIDAVYHGMAELLGPLHEVSYVHIDDARPAAWGWGGVTQQVRAVRKMAM